MLSLVLSFRGQEQFVTDEDDRGVEPSSPQMQECKSCQLRNLQRGTTPVMMVSHQVHRPSYSAARLFRESMEASPLSRQADSGPYSSQPRQEYIILSVAGLSLAAYGYVGA